MKKRLCKADSLLVGSKKPREVMKVDNAADNVCLAENGQGQSRRSL